MSLSLASTWHPRGEGPRLLKLYPQLEAAYAALVVTLPPGADMSQVELLNELPNTRFILSEDWALGRHLALREALEYPCSHVQYADLDRLIRWVETRPHEWRETLDQIREADCTVIGRTAQAWSTHPQAMLQTEKLFNLIFSHLLGQSMDIGAGSKGFSRAAAEFLVANSRLNRAIGSDAEWPVLLHRAGFQVKAVFVDGLDWETPDHHRDRAAEAQHQRELAEEFDQSAFNWERRVQVALEIVETGLAALDQPLTNQGKEGDC